MLESILELLGQLSLELFVAAIGASAGYIFGRFAVSRYKRRKFGGWNVVIIDEAGDIATDRGIGPQKVEEILDDEGAMSVYLKGIASPFGWLNVDLCTTGKEIELLKIDYEGRTITVDLQRNPERKQTPKTEREHASSRRP